MCTSRICAELAQPLTNCSTWESGPHALIGQPSEADFEGMGSSELALREAEKLTLPPDYGDIGWTS